MSIVTNIILVLIVKLSPGMGFQWFFHICIVSSFVSVIFSDGLLLLKLAMCKNKGEKNEEKKPFIYERL